MAGGDGAPGLHPQAASPEFARLVLEIASMLNGFTATEAQFALHQVGRIVGACAAFDIEGAEFKKHLSAFEETYGDDVKPSRRQ